MTQTFKERALEIVRKIPKGKTMSYQEVATLAGSPKASRVVGTLMRKNKDKTVPCHRVICSSGALGNYSGPGGAQGKKEILEREKKEAEEFLRMEAFWGDDDDEPTTFGSPDSDALQGHGSVESWERAKGRGFWGNSSTGYVYDKDA